MKKLIIIPAILLSTLCMAQPINVRDDFSAPYFQGNVRIGDTLGIDKVFYLYGDLFDSAGLGTTLNPIWLFNGTKWTISSSSTDGDSSFVVLQWDTAKAFNNTNLQFVDSAIFQEHLQTDKSFTVNLGLSLLKGIDATSSNFSLKAQDNVGTELFNVRNDGKLSINHSSPVSQLDVVTNGGTNQGAGVRFRNSANTLWIEFGANGSTSFTVPMLKSNSNSNGQGMFVFAEMESVNDVLGSSSHHANMMLFGRKTGGGDLVNSRLLTVSNNGTSRLMIMPDGKTLFHGAGGFVGSSTPLQAMEYRFNEIDTFLIHVDPSRITVTGTTINSPMIRLSGLYDSDATGGVTGTAFKSEIRTIVEDTVPTGRLAISVNGNEHLSINQDGNVGIGVTPVEKLHINGNVRGDTAKFIHYGGLSNFTIGLSGETISFGSDTTSIGGFVKVDSSITYTPISSVPHDEGRVYYDTEDKALSLKTDIVGSTQSLGQEFWTRVINKTGITITDGSLVYINGFDATSGRPTIALGKADVDSTSNVIGFVTNGMANNAEGFVTIMGFVNDLNTTGFTAGEEIFLSDTDTGNFTMTKPLNAIPVGFITKVNASTGQILATIHRKIVDSPMFAQLSDATNQKPTTTSPTSITFDTNDDILGITHSTSTATEDIIITNPGTYTMFAQPQVEKTSGGGTESFHMWVRVGSDDKDTIIDVSIANPSVILTRIAHGLTTGQTVDITNTTITPDINSQHVITVTSDTTYTIPVNVTAVTDTTGNWRRVLDINDDIANSNVSISLTGPSDTDVIPLIITRAFIAGEKINIMQSITATSLGIGLVVMNPSGEPRIPSIIFTINKD